MERILKYKTAIIIFAVIIFIILAAPFLLSEKAVKLSFSKNNGLTETFNITNIEVTVYIGGACENEGYYKAKLTTTYRELLTDAVCREFADISPYPPDKVINGRNILNDNGSYSMNIFLNTLSGADILFCYNINYDMLHSDLNSNIVQKIIEGRPAGGYTKRADLLEWNILTLEEYNSVKYRLYCI